MKQRRLIRILVIGLISLTVIGGCRRAESSPEETGSTTAYTLTFIELGSVNCLPCRAMVPVMERVKKELGDQVNVVFHDVWTKEGEPWGQKYGIRVIPTQVLLNRSGQEIFRHEGYLPQDELYRVLGANGVALP